MDRFSKFLHQLMRKKILYVHITKNFLQYVATLPCKSRKSNNVTDLDSILSSTTVDMFLRTLWRLDLTFNSGETDCLKTANTDWLTFWRLESTAKQFSWMLLHHDDFFTLIIFAPSSLFLRYTSYVVHIFKYKELSCRREIARRFVSLNILLSHSSSLKIIRNDIVELSVCKSLLVFHWNYVCMSYCFWDIQSQRKLG